MTNKEEFERWFNSFDWSEELVPLPVFRVTAWEAWQAARRWIPVSERLPETEKWVAGLDGTMHRPLIVRRRSDGRFEEFGYLSKVKYWQPLPPPPEDV